ncbi:DUF6285 domain-containing protein [Alcanivorax sp. JB21]|uniref:DUF6285 domain-containing protein n=1 Tax=Alcanivorax limicola TaxID=2874102 RepID=UPI001CBCAFFF|nr:DUF6285 domain-containing protein [Alcanivorax limicola]MBZ2188679.1 DUF6285 domain-containing protein [Alcanivorax limicola]
MRIKPDGADLLDTVATVLRDDILPALPAEKHYALRMTLNALGIARRQLQAGDAAEEVEYESLQVLLDQEGSHEEVTRGFADLIRAGGVDDDAALQRMLWSLTAQRVSESAPRYFLQEGLSQEEQAE